MPSGKTYCNKSSNIFICSCVFIRPGFFYFPGLPAPSNSLLTVPMRQFGCGSVLPVFGVKSFGDVSPYVCLDYC